ncbi:hypothetical protein FHR32_003137 [Streptosporangium album]|uniref:Uncharacterized protein n=1 Tax=Streptosporangium album TaxID=47479 RepID=A0A7W7W8Z2_9ACTN|nr:hypothetical protein [Streptosporangium album]MBB4938832.1 hypothetical protein [Streptosporangium album]
MIGVTERSGERGTPVARPAVSWDEGGPMAERSEDTGEHGGLVMWPAEGAV